MLCNRDTGCNTQSIFRTQICFTIRYNNKKKYVQQVDELRIEYSTKQRVLLGMLEAEAKNTTVLEYAIFVGGQQLFPDMDKKELEQLYLFYCQKLQSNKLK